MAEMTDAQASQSLRAAIAGMKYLTRLDEALTAALAADKRLVDAQRSAAEAENRMASLQAEITSLEKDRGGIKYALEEERSKLTAARAETIREQDKTAKAVLDALSSCDLAKKQAEAELFDIRKQVASATADLDAAKKDLAAFHANLGGLTK